MYFSLSIKMDSEIVYINLQLKLQNNAVRKSNFGDVSLNTVNCVVSTVFYTVLIFYHNS